MRKLRKNDFWRIDDRTGFRVPASETVKQWDGLIVSRRHAEKRHPQEFVRARRDDMTVADPRPQQVDPYIGPLRTELTAAAAAGARTLEVLHTERFLGGDRIAFPLVTGDMYIAVVQSVDSSTELTLTVPIPNDAPLGGTVSNRTARAPASLE